MLFLKTAITRGEMTGICRFEKFLSKNVCKHWIYRKSSILSKSRFVENRLYFLPGLDPDDGPVFSDRERALLLQNVRDMNGQLHGDSPGFEDVGGVDEPIEEGFRLQNIHQ